MPRYSYIYSYIYDMSLLGIIWELSHYIIYKSLIILINYYKLFSNYSSYIDIIY